MIIGISGLNSAGKDDMGRYLRQKGFKTFSISDIIREELKKRGQEITRDSLVDVGNEMRRKHGSDYWTDQIIRKLEKDKDYAIISIRNPGEVNAFRRVRDFTLVFIEAPIEMRYERAKHRGLRESEGNSLEEFQAKEERELASTDKSSQQLLECRKLADFIISNDSDIETFHSTIDALLQGLK